MGRVVDVELNKVNTLITLGSMYRNAGDAIKEYVSNALDEWAMARRQGRMEGPCRVQFILARNFISIEYNAPGMEERDFEDALKHVVDSPKQDLDTPQIGQFGIGIWAFNQMGTEATFCSRRDLTSPTIKVSLRRDSSEAEFSAPGRGEERREPGMTIIISGLFHDPTKRYGPLTPARLKHLLADRFDAYLRAGQLEITITCGKEVHQVEPHRLDLPEIGTRYREVSLLNDSSKVFQTKLWFDPSGDGRVSIRHTGVAVVDDLRSVPEYDLDETIYTSGFIKGFIDADFLNPLPARARFVENEKLIAFLNTLRHLSPHLEKEIAVFREEAENERMQGLLRRATRIAREILSQEEFLGLELIEGLSRVRPRGDGEHTVSIRLNRPVRRNGGNGKDGRRTSREYRPIVRQTVFEGDLRRRSRLSDGTIEININSPDFLALSEVPRSQQVAYLALLLGKEIIAYNDSSGVSDEALEKMVAYGAKVIKRVWR